MNKLLFALSLFIGFQLQAQRAVDADQMLQEFFQNKNIPSLSVSIMQKGELVFSKGYGYADLVKEIPVDPSSTLFRIGSVSKTLTAAGLGRLYDQAKIDLDVPIERYVPIWPKKAHQVTLRMLAGHLGGIRHYGSGEFMSRTKYKSVSEGLAIFINDPLINQPGTEYAYSSYGWNLISAAMENAAAPEASFLSTIDFLSFMQSEVFDELDMKNTVPDHADQQIANRAKFYQVKNEQLVEAPYVDNSYKWAGGGFIGTTEDLCKFGQAHMEAGYLSAKTLKTWMRSQKTTDGKFTNYGIGWRTFDRESGKTFYGHSGSSVGGLTYFLIHIPTQTTLAITANVDPLAYDGIPFQLMELFTD